MRTIGLVLVLFIYVGMLNFYGQEKSNYWIKAIGGPGQDYAPSFLQEENGYVIVGWFTIQQSVKRENFPPEFREKQGFLKNKTGRIKVEGKKEERIEIRPEGKGLQDRDIFVIKTDRDANIIWAKTFGGPKRDEGFTVTKTDDNGYIVTGNTESFGNGKIDAIVTKFNSNGEIEWATVIGGPDIDMGMGAVKSFDNKGYVLAGMTRSFPDGDIMIVKIDNNGKLITSKLLKINGSGNASAISGTSDGGYILGGQIIIPKRNHDILLVKLDKDLNLEWAKAIGTDGEEGMNWDGIRQTKDGGWIYASNVGPRMQDMQQTKEKSDFVAVKLKANGDVEWAICMGEEFMDAGWTMNETTDGYIAGGVWSKQFSDRKEDMGDIILTKIDKKGRVIWVRTIDGTGQDLDEIEEIKEVSDGYVMSGVIGMGERNTDVLFAKVNRDGLIEGFRKIKTINPIVKNLILFPLRISGEIIDISIKPVYLRNPESRSPKLKIKDVEGF
ncbi:MAG: hypothetical protein NC827_03990 [Candidatus Omnitrophica bacterium]|nr:hypothetical protein [Candidatus Omnitrophota bacterium]MCM8802453.1 hypothetical protein [Candidatus Omnitrophota bacterium]